MLLHFLRHYHRLGVWPSHTSVAIRARRSASLAATNATLRVLQQAGVPGSNVRMIHAPPSDTLKIQLMNEHLMRLGSADWSIYADVDELFDYPCELQGAVTRNKYCFAGAMWDQLAADGNITEVAESPDLAVQYPLQCRIRATVVPRLQISKVILHRVYGNARADAPPDDSALVRFRTTHSIVGNNSMASRCAVRGLVRHYTMTARQRMSNAQKAALKVSGTNPADRRNYANATCGNIDAHTGACLDYALLQRFMDNQVEQAQGKRSSKGSRERTGSASAGQKPLGLSQLCPMSLERMQKGAPCGREHPEMC